MPGEVTEVEVGVKQNNHDLSSTMQERVSTHTLAHAHKQAWQVPSRACYRHMTGQGSRKTRQKQVNEQNTGLQA